MERDIKHPSQPRSVAEVLSQVDEMVKTGAAQELIPFPTNFTPLDQVLAGGVRPGDLVLVGGTPGVPPTSTRSPGRTPPARTWSSGVKFVGNGMSSCAAPVFTISSTCERTSATLRG